MDVVKIRRQGNSLGVTLDQRTLGEANLHEGDLVASSVRNGTIVLTPVDIRPRTLAVGRRVIEANRRVLDRLAKDERGKGTTGRR